MKKYLHVVTLLIIALPVFSQVPKPFWAENTPFPPANSGYIFAWGEGHDKNPVKAKNIAFADAVQKAMYELGNVHLSEQAIADIQENGLQAISGIQKRAIKERCSTPPLILMDGETYKVYVLIQVQIDANYKANFYSLPENFTTCEDPEFEKEMESRVKTKNLEIEKQEKLSKRENDPFFAGNKNNYIAWSIVGFEYPFTFKTTLSGRFGGLVGGGFFANVGLGYQRYEDYFSHYSSRYIDTRQDVTFHYNVGAIFYPYKNFLISCGYGTIPYGRTLRLFHDYDEWNSYIPLTKTGLTLAAGWNYMTDMSDMVGFFLSLKAGACYDLQESRWQPYAGLSVGLSWGF